LQRAILLALAVSTASLSSCAKGPIKGACAQVPELQAIAPSNVTGAPKGASRARALACIHHEAYRLAPAGIDARTVADAVMGACQKAVYGAELEKWLGTYNAHDEGGLPPGFQLGGCEKGSACEKAGRSWDEGKVQQEASRRVAELKLELREQALFRVVEARAGHCSPPDIPKG